MREWLFRRYKIQIVQISFFSFFSLFSLLVGGLQTNMKKTHLTEKSWYYCTKLPQEVAPTFNDVMESCPTTYDTMKILGKDVALPRYTRHYLRPYFYAGTIHPSDPLPDNLKSLVKWCNDTFNFNFDQVLVNYYMDGHHYIGAHSDDTRQLKRGSPIISISLGQERVFRIRKKTTKEIVANISLPDETVFVMGGDFQQEFTHEIVKVAGVKGEKLKPRVNITLRSYA